MARTSFVLLWVLASVWLGACVSNDGGGDGDIEVTRSALISSQIVVPVTGDAYIDSAHSSRNSGYEVDLHVRNANDASTLVQVDPAKLNAALGSATVQSARITLTLRSRTENWAHSGGQISVHRIAKATRERGATWNCAVDAQPFNTSTNCSGAQAWNPAVAGNAWASAATSTKTMTNGMTGTVSFDVTADIAALRAGTIPGNGWLLRTSTSTTRGHAEFWSRETSYAPSLVLTLAPGSAAPPEPGDEDEVELLTSGEDTYVSEGRGNENGNGERTTELNGSNSVLVKFTAAQVASALAAHPDGRFVVELTIADDDGDWCDNDHGRHRHHRRHWRMNWNDGQPVGIHRVKQSWSAAQATWSCAHDLNVSNRRQDCSGAEAWTLWNTTNASAFAWAVDASDVEIVGHGRDRVLQFDVTNDVKAFGGGATNFGWLVRTEEPTDSANLDFHAFEARSRRPVLRVYDRVGDEEDAGPPVDAGVDAPSCTPTAATDSTCDGVDDDCSGAADEDYVSGATSCGIGACAASGVRSCVNGVVQNTCSAGAPAANDATCNGVDDDCDGAADDDFASTSISCGVGACGATGSTSCVGGGVVSSCLPGTPAASDATCDGVDDDCNGVADEDFASTATACGVGACAAMGATACVNGSVSDTCSPGAPALNDATCDGVDDDCNGTADEDYASQSTSCGVGACGATGATSCVSGAVANSCSPGSPAANDSTCDGVDDDCDGTADEDYASQATSCGVGACGATGATSCVDGAVADSCTPGTPAPSDATCDGVDDDCSGAADEDYASQATSCGVGACGAMGATSCVDGTVADSCTAGSPAADDSSCNGVDDDCNGTADEDYGPATTVCGVGACGAAGVTFCVGGLEGDSCNPGTPAPSDATCNAIDDDCDGFSDEDFAGMSTTCGIGACGAAGSEICVVGEVVDTCSPGAPAANDPCGNGDDDCDGTADEDCCVPTTCQAQGAACGSIPDGCGNTIDCGGCGATGECGVVTANQCAPRAAWPAKFNMPPSVYNLSSWNAGARVLTTSGEVIGGNKQGAITPAAVWTASSAAGDFKFIDIDLAGTDVRVFDSVSFGASPGNARDFDVWVSEKPTYNAADFVLIYANTVTPAVRSFSFPAKRARFVRVRLLRASNVGQSTAWSVSLSDFAVQTRNARTGGLLSLYEDGARVVGGTTPRVGAEGDKAIDANTTDPGWIVDTKNASFLDIHLISGEYPASLLLLGSHETYSGETPANVTVSVSTSATGPFTTSGTGSTGTNNFAHYVELSAVAGSYVRLASSGNTGHASITQLTDIKVWSEQLGSNTVAFDDTTYTGVGGPTEVSWVWSFGDGQSSTAQHPVHTYAAPGTYNVTLRIVDSAGAFNDVARSYTVQ